MATAQATRGNYRFAPGAEASPYSSGGIADPGYEIVHATLQTPLPIWDGFAAIDRYLSSVQRPRAALCALELRCARPYEPDAWMSSDSFNQRYIAKLFLRVNSYTHRRDVVVDTNPFMGFRKKKLW